MSGRILVLGAYLRREKPDFVFTVGESLLRRPPPTLDMYWKPALRRLLLGAKPNRRLRKSALP